MVVVDVGIDEHSPTLSPARSLPSTVETNGGGGFRGKKAVFNGGVWVVELQSLLIRVLRDL